MQYDPERHHRRSIRLKGHDYASVGLYFVTVCIWQKECNLGHITEGEMVLSEAGAAVQAVWQTLPQRFESLRLDAFVVMPNHVHGVLCLSRSPGDTAKGAASSAPTVGQIVRAYKSLSALHINRLLGRSERPAWQRNYYEHIVRGDEALNQIRRYIALNPARWEEDEENPKNAPRSTL